LQNIFPDFRQTPLNKSRPLEKLTDKLRSHFGLIGNVELEQIASTIEKKLKKVFDSII
jgi:hypothetical protein